MKTKGIIFDYGGTLNTAGCHWGIMLWQAYQRHQVPVTEEQFRQAYVYGERALGKNPIIQPNYTFHKTLDIKVRIEFDHLREQGWWICDNETRKGFHTAILEDLYQQVIATTAASRQVLQVLKTQLPLALVSNFYGNLSVVLNEFQLSDLFQDVIESAVVGVRKPDKRIFQLGVEALGLCPEEVLVVGDSLDKDILPAQQLGCRTAWLKGQGWTDSPMTSIQPDYTIHTIKDVDKAL